MLSQQHLDTSAAEKDSSRPAGVLESKGGSTEPPSTLDPTTPVISIRHRLASIVNRELEKMERGEIDELSTQHNDMLHQLLQSPRRQHRQLRRQQSSRQQGARQRGSHRGSQHQRKPRPHCTYDRCEKPVGHWESTCLQKARDIRGRRDASKRDRSTSPRRDPRRDPRRFRRHHHDDDEEEDNADEEAGSTHGDDNDGAQLLQRYLQWDSPCYPNGRRG